MQQGDNYCCLQFSVGGVVGLCQQRPDPAAAWLKGIIWFVSGPARLTSTIEPTYALLALLVVNSALQTRVWTSALASGPTQLLHLLTTFMILLLSLVQPLFAQQHASCSAVTIRHCRTTIMQL
jgi:hypothetical protein